MRKILFTLFALFCLISFLPAQQAGDTIVVQTFDYSSATRDTVVEFPDDPDLTFERIIMRYNMRCKDGLVSPPVVGQTNRGCGEWDYSNNTFIYDSTRVDSVLRFQSSHFIAGFSGDEFPYLLQPTYAVMQHRQFFPTILDTLSEQQFTLGAGLIEASEALPTDRLTSRAQYLLTQDELLNAGLSQGQLNGLILQVAQGVAQARFLRLRIKPTAKTVLDGDVPELEGWQTVYFADTDFAPGENRLNFHTPFSWDGTSHLLLDFSFSQNTPGESLSLLSEELAQAQGLMAAEDRQLLFNGNNYIQAEDYQGIAGQAPRTVEAWIRTTEVNGEIVSWGVNRNSEKWVIRLNDDGVLRLEVNGGNVRGTQPLNDGQWHHIAVVFEGSSLAGTTFYVDGEVEPFSATSNHPVNTAAELPVRVSRGVNNRYWNGAMDDIRIWSAILEGNTIRQWMHRRVESSHPAYAKLELYYPLNEAEGLLVEDHSLQGHDGTIINFFDYREMPAGVEIFKGFQPTLLRPQMTLLQGNYELQIDTLLVEDTLLHPPTQVIVYQVNSNAGSSQSDEVVGTDPADYWTVQANEVLDPEGNLITSDTPMPDGSIDPGEITWFQRYPARYEIMSFVTPYGINLDLGPEGKTWYFDVSDFGPILKGQKRMQMTFGGQFQEDMDVQFLFIVGTPPREVLEIQHLWRTSGNENYNNILNDRVFEPREVQLRPDAAGYKLTSAITGHGQEGEFIPRDHFIDLDGGDDEFVWTVWKECAFNPVFPQGGTWIYDRSGWCPGMATDKQEWDITPLVDIGGSVEIDYGLYTASGDSRYIVNNQLVTYGPAKFGLDAAIVDIIRPTDQITHGRLNPICHEPQVIIRNTGADTLTSLEIKYWLNNAVDPEVYTWTGSLAFLESEEIDLPSPPSLWNALGSGENSFNVEISSPNSGPDEYAFNNSLSASFVPADVIPQHFYIWFGTNNVASENSYEVLDADGNILFSREDMSNNTIYQDTLMLAPGCYTFRVYDTDNDGLSFFANNDGSGFIRFREVGGPIVASFESDFGGGIEYNFSTDLLVSTHHPPEQALEVQIFPNPVESSAQIQIEGGEGWIRLRLNSATGREVYREDFRAISGQVNHTLELQGLASGIYFLEVQSEQGREVKRLVKK